MLEQNEAKPYDGRIMNISGHYLNELNDCNDAHYLRDKLMFIRLSPFASNINVVMMKKDSRTIAKQIDQ
jgi:hypothetical protein